MGVKLKARRRVLGLGGTTPLTFALTPVVCCSNPVVVSKRTFRRSSNPLNVVAAKGLALAAA